MAAYIVSSTISNILVKCDQASAIEWMTTSSSFVSEERLQFNPKKLEMTLRMIRARLGDAERRGEGQNEQLVNEWLNHLKLICYRLEDLLEEAHIAFELGMFSCSSSNSINLELSLNSWGTIEDLETVKAPKRMRTSYPSSSSSSTINLELSLNSLGTTKELETVKAPKRLCTSFPSSNSMKNELALEAKGIMEELDHLTKLMEGLQFRELPLKQESVVNVTDDRQTHSFICEDEVIGRDVDKDKIVSLLLDTDHGDENVSVIPIVGIGGIGKTTLAQLVFNDQRVRSHFEEKYWACISDISRFEELAGKVLRAITRDDSHQLTLEEIQLKIREKVNQKKYFLVMDDLWDEDKKRWLKLWSLLRGGKRGSKIIVTSRSLVVAQNMGTVTTHELRGLTNEKSWELFRSLAFKEGQEERHPNMAPIGKEILKKCANVPLVIRTIACLLYTMDTESEWESFKDKELITIEQTEKSILSTLKLSYDRLPSQLKLCFAYCSVFPKDYEFEEEQMIYLWRAQGFIESSNGQPNPEIVGHGYFMQLQRRCFFQKYSEWDDGTIAWKMHDLVHDLAQFVANGETLSVDKPTCQSLEAQDTLLHVGVYSEAPLQLVATKRTRSLLFAKYHRHNFDTEMLFAHLRSIRALDMGWLGFEKLPDSLGELKHLRYLRICIDTGESLPECITRLLMLQTLDLRESNFKLLPRNIEKLTKLRHLRINNFPDMPYELGQLTSLHTLDTYVVGERNGLDALASLSNLAGKLEIWFKMRAPPSISPKTGILKSTKLTELSLVWGSNWNRANKEEEDEEALRCLHPPPSLQYLHIYEWGGVRFGFLSRRMEEYPSLLPNLVSIFMRNCRKCQHLPPLSGLPHLKSIHLEGLPSLEYIEMVSGDNFNTHAASSSSSARSRTYFPSLETLKLIYLPELKGWSHGQDDENLPWLPPFPRLSDLDIFKCPKLKSMPSAPNLVSLFATDCPNLTYKILLGSSTSIKKLYITGREDFRGITGELQNLAILEKLTISDPWNLGKVDEHSAIELLVSETMRALACITTLQKLRVVNCIMRALPESVGHLTQLRHLSICGCDELEALPETIGNLTLLETLLIDDCKLRALPESFGNLAAHLQSLTIEYCPELVRRCREEYWPLIQHIPRVNLL